MEEKLFMLLLLNLLEKKEKRGVNKIPEEEEAPPFLTKHPLDVLRESTAFMINYKNYPTRVIMDEIDMFIRKLYVFTTGDIYTRRMSEEKAFLLKKETCSFVINEVKKLIEMPVAVVLEQVEIWRSDPRLQDFMKDTFNLIKQQEDKKKDTSMVI